MKCGKLERAREAVRRHRARRKAQRKAMLGTAQYWAIHRVDQALRDMLYGKVGGSGEVQTRDRTDALAVALFDALGPERTARLAAQLAAENNSAQAADSTRPCANRFPALVTPCLTAAR